MKAFLIITFTVFITAFCNNGQKNIIQSEEAAQFWEEDIYQMVHTIDTGHPEPYRFYEQQAFNKDVDGLVSSLSYLSDAEIKFRMMELVAKLGDGHTAFDMNSLIGEKGSVYPFHLEWMEEGLYVTRASREYEHLIDAQLLSINQKPVSEITDSINALISYDSMNWADHLNKEYILSEDVLRYVHPVEEDRYIWEFVTNNGKKAAVEAEPVRLSELPDTEMAASAPLESSFSNLPFSYGNSYGFRVMEEGYVYVQVQRADEIHFHTFSQELVEKIETASPGVIIFDFRNHTGGDSSLLSELISNLTRAMKKDIQTYLLIGRGTFSTGVINALEIKNNRNAKVYGEESGQSLHHFGEVGTETLPHSGLTLSYSSKEFKLDSQGGPMEPEVSCSQKYKDYVKGIDTCLKLIREEEAE